MIVLLKYVYIYIYTPNLKAFFPCKLTLNCMFIFPSNPFVSSFFLVTGKRPIPSSPTEIRQGFHGLHRSSARRLATLSAALSKRLQGWEVLSGIATGVDGWSLSFISDAGIWLGDGVRCWTCNAWFVFWFEFFLGGVNLQVLPICFFVWFFLCLFLFVCLFVFLFVCLFVGVCWFLLVFVS